MRLSHLRKQKGRVKGLMQNNARISIAIPLKEEYFVRIFLVQSASCLSCVVFEVNDEFSPTTVTQKSNRYYLPR